MAFECCSTRSMVVFGGSAQRPFPCRATGELTMQTLLIVVTSLLLIAGHTCERPGGQRRADRVDRRHRQPSGHRRGQAREHDVHQRRRQEVCAADDRRSHRRQQVGHRLVTKLKVTPEDNPTSQSLKSEGEKNVAQLKGLKAWRSTRRTSITKSPITSR